jgi:branched-subunit amino acid aminotransferase/4-amino-4-deoxychorismate lyase
LASIDLCRVRIGLTTDTYRVNPPQSPDRNHGLFETLLVAEGRPVALDAHLDRLAASVREIFGSELPPSLREEAERATEGTALGRLRIDLAPGREGALVPSFAVAPIDPEFTFPQQGEALRAVVAPGWSGGHKWADRGWLEEVEAELGEEVPLIVDGDGHALEAGRANVFLVLDGVLVTPPADSRILPGTARAATIELARELGIEVAERPISLHEVRSAEGVFLTSSVRGLRPARSLDGAPLDRSSDLVERLAAALRERWLSGLSSAASAAPGARPPGRSA